MEQKHSDQRWAEQVRTLGEAQVTVTRHWESKQQPWASGTCSECSNTALGHAHGGLFHRAVDPIEHTLIGWRGVSNNTIALRWCYKCFYSHVYIGGCKMWTISNQKKSNNAFILCENPLISNCTDRERGRWRIETRWGGGSEKDD